MVRIIGLFLGACLVGVAIAGTVFYCAWNGQRKSYGYRESHMDAMNMMHKWIMALEDYRKANGKYPVRLTDAFDMPNQDPWGNPYQYQARGKGYALTTLGRDGKPGGVGLNADLVITELTANDEGFSAIRRSSLGSPTLSQFAFGSQAAGVWLTSSLAGVFAVVACLVSIKPWSTVARPSWFRLSATLVFCVFVGVVMSVFHVPSHH